ncbi:MAG: hypothetical protein WCC59_18885 [Terriglobales bacterium]
MSSLTDQWLEIFRAGDYGAKGNYSAADLQAIASSYDPSSHEAPVTIGHPEMNAPAFGWVEKLKASGGTLLAKLRQVQPAFEDLVRRGSFKKRSVAFYRPDGGSQLRLRHLAFLGAQPPEVKGLADPQFAQFSESNAAVCVDFEEHVPARGLQVDPASVVFAERVQRRAAERGVTFGEAMRELTSEEAGMKFSGAVIDVRSTAIAEAAKQRARGRNITFAEGLRQINEEDATRAALDRLRANGSVDPRSIMFMEAAQERAAADQIPYGEALKLVYQESGSTLPPRLKVLVAAVEGGTIVLNQGSDVGVKVGDRFTVQRLGTEVVDPFSNKVIRQMVTCVGELQVTEVEALSSLATGVAAADLRVGDICEPIAAG